jgi:hypothetical protein
MSGQIDGRLRDALEDLERYLADQVAPLLVADSVETLFDYPPALTAEALYHWSHTQQSLRGGGEAISDLAYHALKKIQLFEELQLLPPDRLVGFLAAAAERLIELAPELERERLASRLQFLRQGHAATVPIVDRLHRAPEVGVGAAPAPAAAAVSPLSPEELRALRRFSLLVDRLPAGAGAPGGLDESVAARQLLVLAAAEASNAGELERRLARLQEAGVGPAVSRDLVRSLASAIPDWILRRGERVEIVHGESVEAVRRVVRLAGDKARTTERWKDLLRSAAESFNQGAYARAATLLDLADRMVRDGEVDAHVADLTRGSAHSAFEPARLLAAASDEQNRPILRRMVEFFPDWSVRELLDDLVFQPDPKRRRLLLALLEIWGAEAYRPVLDRLAAAITENSRDPNAWWYHRNLVYLLHRLPRPDEVDAKQVLELAGGFSTLGHHPSFQRETFTLLGQLPGGLGAPLLVQRLKDAERALAGTAPPPHEPREMEKILGSLAAPLARTGSPVAWRALIEHGLAQRPRTGDASARLRELAGVDLSADRESLSRLLEAARFLRPKKLLGFVVSRNEATLADVARALSGTSDAAARRLLADLAEQFPDREVGRIAGGGPPPAGAAAAGSAAAAAVESDEEEAFVPTPARRPVAAPRASLSGDLEIFGLPGLIQNLQQSEASGRLVLRRTSGEERATMQLVGGRLGECRYGELEGEAAFYQIFEHPTPGTFEFAREVASTAAGRSAGVDPLALLMEAMRRFDEFQQLRVLLPDQARLRPGSVRPSTPESERDGEVVRRVWTRAREGGTVTEVERAALVDSYRVRILLAHWLEEGAVELAGAEAAAADGSLAG